MSAPYMRRTAAGTLPFQRAWRTALIVCSAVVLSACLVDAENERFDESLGFYDVDAQGAPRTVRNDLSGALSGMVQFAQSHVVDPSGNAERNMPDVVTSRGAVLLFTPQTPLEDGELSVEVWLDGQKQQTLAMQAPLRIDRSDFVDAHGRPDVLYTKRAWTARLPWDVMRKGLSLRIISSDGQQGILASDRISFAAPAQLTVWGIRLGMLTDPPINDQQLMLSQPALAGTDYFQTVPIASLTVASYEDMRLDRVMVGDGSILTSASTRQGDVYSGDLREDVGKAQFSIGINLANYGVSSSRLNSQSLAQTTTQFVYHHSAGNYSNGRVLHGLSGGGAIGTLYDSTGNEWSHEIGHHYGMGHYPGCVHDKGDYFWSAHHANSGWGHIAHRKRFRSNLAFDNPARDGLKVNGFENRQSFQGLYSYNADAMSGGWVSTDPFFSRYTHHTGYTAQRIQNWLNRAWIDPSSSTGYSRYDASTGRVVAASPEARPKPTHFGVPVFTLLGGYDPVRRTAVMYPPARANFGQVFENLQTPSNSSMVDACWLDILKSDGSSRLVAIAATRLDGGVANKFHVNVAQAEQPQSAALVCRQSGVTSQLATVQFPRSANAMTAAVHVGQQAGFEALAALELPQWEQGLMAVAAQREPMPDRQTLWLTDSWRERADRLSPQAQAVLQRREAFLKRVQEFDRWMGMVTVRLQRRHEDTMVSMRQKITANGWKVGDQFVPRFTQVKGEGGQCMALKMGGDAQAVPQVVVLPATSCANESTQGWMMDARGAIRNARLPDHCLTLAPNNQLAMRYCDDQQLRQVWRVSANRMIQSVHQPQLALDIDRSQGIVIAYPAHGGGNQQWQGLVRHDQSPWIVYMSGINLNRLYQIEPMF